MTEYILLYNINNVPLYSRVLLHSCNNNFENFDTYMSVKSVPIRFRESYIPYTIVLFKLNTLYDINILVTVL